LNLKPGDTMIDSIERGSTNASARSFISCAANGILASCGLNGHRLGDSIGTEGLGRDASPAMADCSSPAAATNRPFWRAVT
jgi:hypothetical protein